MTRAPGPLLPALSVATALGLLGALCLRRPELAAAAAPLAVLVGLGLRTKAPDVRVWFEAASDRALEDDEIEVIVTVQSTTGVERLELGLVLPIGLEIVDGSLPTAIHLTPGEERELPLRLRCRRFGAYTLGDVRLRCRDRLGLVRFEGRTTRWLSLRVYPRPERVQALVSPARTQSTTGNEVARVRAEGFEFADTRPFVAGDRPRSINWRASARRDALVVNERHPERNADVVIFLDSFAEARLADDGTLEQAVRLVATIAEQFLERRDRVGLVTFGGVLRWLEPGGGMVQKYRLLDALLQTGVELSYAWKDVSVIPPRTLQPRALVVAISPLLDERSIEALLDLCGRGHDLLLLEISPEPHVIPGPSAQDRAAHHLWTLQRAELRARFRRLGVAVSTLDETTTLDDALEGVRTYRRKARVARR